MKTQAPENDSNRIDFESVFKRLNDELIGIGQSLELICAGGYVMQRYGYRATSDIDAFYNTNALIESIIRKVGDEFCINKEDELWLNNSISNLNDPPPDEYCEFVYEFSNLVVKAVRIQYLIGMKLSSQREQDLKDVGSILRHDNNEQPFKLLKTLKCYGFDADISLILEVFEKAHGMSWLERFYNNNLEELRRYF